MTLLAVYPNVTVINIRTLHINIGPLIQNVLHSIASDVVT